MDEWMTERLALAKMRVAQIVTEEEAPKPFRAFFNSEAAFLSRALARMEKPWGEETLQELAEENKSFYEDIFAENYQTCYGNPAYAASALGEYGAALCFLYGELRGAVVYAFENRIWDMTVTLELFLEVYSAFTQEELPGAEAVKKILCSYVNDYSHDMMEQRIREGVDASLDFAVRIVMDSDLTDLRYLYRYGEFVSENELGAARFLNSLSQEEIDDMARTYTEGYRIGFIAGRKDMSKKKTVNIRYNLGFERMVRAAVHRRNCQCAV